MKPPSEWLTPKYSAHTNTLEQSPHHCHIQRTNKYEKILCVEILLAVIAGLPVAIIDEIVWKAFWKLKKIDPVGSTVRYEMMKLCTGSV